MTKAWDKYREIIVYKYKEQNEPLHEVQKFMMRTYGFRASTRAYRSRFDRWGVYKYSRRQRLRTSSLSREDSVSACTVRPTPQLTPDVDDRGPHDPSPPAATTPPTTELMTPAACVTTPEGHLRHPLCHIKNDFQYTSIAPSPSSAMAYDPSFPLLGSGLPAFNSHGICCYSDNLMPLYRTSAGDPVMMPPDTSGQGRFSLPGTQPGGYGYSTGPLKAHH